jgi:hypothetical protein
MDVYSLRLNWNVPIVGVLQNVLYYQQTTNPTDTQRRYAEGLIDAWKTTVGPAWTACIPTDSVLTSISARRMSDTGGATYTVIEDMYGSAATPTGNSGIAMNIAMTPVTFPWEPGHIYLGPTPADWLAENIWQPNALALAQPLCNELKKQINGTLGSAMTWNQVIWTRKSRTPRAIDEYLIRSKPTAMNRRLKPFPA